MFKIAKYLNTQVPKYPKNDQIRKVALLNDGMKRILWVLGYFGIGYFAIGYFVIGYLGV